MRLILIFTMTITISSCTTTQKISSDIAESNRILKERAEGAKKISEAKANVNSHKIMEIDIPQPKEKPEKPKPVPPQKKIPGDFDEEPKGMIKRGSNVEG